MRTIPNISNLLKKIDNFITSNFIPAIIGGIICSHTDRKLLALPPKLGGLGIPIFSDISDFEYQNSRLLTQNLCNKILQQDRKYKSDDIVKDIKSKISTSRKNRNEEILQELRKNMSQHQQRLNDINQEPGASSWISTMQLETEGYVLNKQLFWDLVRIRYGWELNKLPENVHVAPILIYNMRFHVKKGGFISIRHNQVRNITASLLNETCKDVRIEPTLQKLTGENLQARTANVSDEARLDVSARGFWNAGQTAFFDIRVFNPNASRYGKTEISNCYEINE